MTKQKEGWERLKVKVIKSLVEILNNAYGQKHWTDGYKTGYFESEIDKIIRLFDEVYGLREFEGISKARKEGYERGYRDGQNTK